MRLTADDDEALLEAVLWEFIADLRGRGGWMGCDGRGGEGGLGVYYSTVRPRTSASAAST